MYYPYLRGRQYELIALRELAEKKILGNKIIPIIEPVKASSTLLSIMDLYTSENKEFGIIQNPEHGTFYNEMAQQKIDKERYYGFFSEKKCCLPVYIFNRNITNVPSLPVEQKSIAICIDKDIIQLISTLTQKYNTDRFMIQDDRVYKRGIHGNRILMADNFNKQQKNADYVRLSDEFFSDDHLYFENEGYKGFSDFSVIGKDYIESGFAPLAVAIHMVYFDQDKNLRVHHFVSDSNFDYDDPAGKFGEALEKLIKSPIFKNIGTYAYGEFESLYKNRIYPGLGVVKKLSIMHHIELISRYFQEIK